MSSLSKIDLLVVARWPLGGIRTYMKYVYRYLREGCDITILAASTPEDSALKKDAEEIGARLILHESGGKDGLFRMIFSELLRKKYDVIQSQGFISSIQTYFANIFFGVPHILTVHGILEERYLKGRAARIKRRLLSGIIKNIDVVYAVSNDILGHLSENIPGLEASGCVKVVINNGVDLRLFSDSGCAKGAFRNSLGIGPEIFLISFLGRFMPEKGFHHLIDAVEILEGKAAARDFKVLAVGSGAYLDWYRRIIRDKGLEHRFSFIPFQDEVAAIYRDTDAVVMPSVWEAFPLQPMEAMCSGTPLIASDCMGLREAVENTPAVVFKSGDAPALAGAIRELMLHPVDKCFEAFKPAARERFDVCKTAEALRLLLTDQMQRKR